MKSKNLLKIKILNSFMRGGAFVQHSSNNKQLVGEIKIGGNSG
ncbi:hypothetical protein MSU_0130 [Mycoplasma suis str. Illinois]|uniref:Uncharacterized protein n=1 Tax=Mycoplasma suis (strain Illinois) TaxID=768700 RepID=F0QQA4_MYCSL|nr:hypothetical protein MSU_0130 [Mycoplasma suis str. Illinois]